MKSNLFLNSDVQNINFGLVFFGPPGILLIILTEKKLLEVSTKKNYKKKQKKQDFRIEKVIKSKGDKLYVKWKRYDNSFNSWIYKKT